MLRIRAILIAVKLLALILCGLAKSDSTSMLTESSEPFLSYMVPLLGASSMFLSLWFLIILLSLSALRT